MQVLGPMVASVVVAKSMQVSNEFDFAKNPVPLPPVKDTPHEAIDDVMPLIIKSVAD